jgi:hypothetical protein
MARWTAKCWLGSKSGYQNLEVSANTMSGAKEQLIHIYGAQQVINLRKVSDSGSSSIPEFNGGSWTLLGGLIALFLIVEYWYVIIPASVVVVFVWWFFYKD